LTTLDSPKVNEVLQELHRRAAAEHPRNSKVDFASIPPAERYMAVDPSTGQLLYLLTRLSQSKNIVEFGTSFGVSTCYLAAALKDNGGGKVIATEMLPSKAAACRVNLMKAELREYVDLREGDALQTLAQNLPEKIDFVFLDGAKYLYTSVLRLLKPNINERALVVADNMNRVDEEFFKWLRDNDFIGLEIPFKGGVGVFGRF